VHTYIGTRTPSKIVSISQDGSPPTHRLHHIKHHSPTGFEWGYGGSGPADLALSILAHHFGENPTPRQLATGDCKCWRLHQAFKWHFIASADKENFAITDAQIDEWLTTINAPSSD